MLEAHAPATDLREMTALVRDAVLGNQHCYAISASKPNPLTAVPAVDQPLRFELFHFVGSLCSHKVRVTLAALGASYIAADMMIMPPENHNYYAEYARLRKRATAFRLHAPAASFTGRSSVETEGFDPLVVPLLVDHDRQLVIADSKAICLYLCEAFKEQRDLLPAEHRPTIEAQLAAVDATPHVALLYGANPLNDHRPESVMDMLSGVHARKLVNLKRNMERVADDPELVAGYHNKIAKETAAARFVADPDSMTTAIEQTRAIIARLDEDLATAGDGWLVGGQFTLADIFWAISLFRLTWLGYADLWTAHPCVERYAERLFAEQSVRDGLLHWPGHPPSDTTRHLMPGPIAVAV